MLIGMVLSIIIGLLSVPQTSLADVEWTIEKQRSLDVTPLDIASSLDGQWVYILSSGEIAVFSVLDDKVISRIPVAKTVDKISYAGQTNTLIVSSSIGKSFKIIQLEMVQKFALEGLAYKGPENAPVTIAVFSDYQ